VVRSGKPEREVPRIKGGNDEPERGATLGEEVMPRPQMRFIGKEQGPGKKAVNPNRKRAGPKLKDS